VKKFVAARPFADPDAAARKLVEIANATEAVQDGRIFIELVNAAFLAAGGSPAEYRAGLEARSQRAGCGGTGPGRSRNSPRPRPSCSSDGYCSNFCCTRKQPYIGTMKLAAPQRVSRRTT
jgi:hypothetical protein